MGKIFGGGGKTQTTTQQSTTKPWEPAVPYLENILKDTSKLYTEQGGINTAYINRELAKLSPEMQQAAQSLIASGDMKGLTSELRGAFGQAMGGLKTGQDVMGQFATGGRDISTQEIGRMAKDLYQEDVVRGQSERLGKRVREQLGEEIQGLNQAAVGTGGMGSSRAGVEAGVAKGKAAEAITSGIGQIEEAATQDALSRAMNIAAGNRQQQLSGAQSTGQLGLSAGSQQAGLGQNYQQMLANQLQGAGIGQNFAQQQADIDWMNQVGAQGAGWDAIQRYLNMVGGIGGMGGTSSGTSTTPKQGGGMGGLGGLMGGAGGLMQGLGSMGMTFSDKRLKKSIKTVGWIGPIRAVEWEWSKKAEKLFGFTGKAQGVIAQELAEILPGCVVLTESGYLAVDYDLLNNTLDIYFKDMEGAR